MINFDDVTDETIKAQYPNWLKTPDHLKRILIVGNSGLGKTNSITLIAFINLINH